MARLTATCKTEAHECAKPANLHVNAHKGHLRQGSEASVDSAEGAEIMKKKDMRPVVVGRDGNISNVALPLLGYDLSSV